MKIFIKLMVFLVVLACAAPFILKRSDGSPWMTIDDLKFPYISLPDFNLSSTPEEAVIDDSAVYKWLDQNGVMQYSDKPDTTSDIERVRIDQRANMSHFEIPKPVAPELPSTGVASSKNKETMPADPQGSPYTQIPELIDRAKNIGQVLNQREQQQGQMINNLD